MGIRQFLDFVIISSADSVTFAESSESPPLWVIETQSFAGQPSLSITSRTRFRTTVTTVALTGARYPGTSLPADLEITVTEFPETENQPASQTVTLTTAFANASFHFETDPQTQIDSFLEWLEKRTDASTPISIAGAVATFASGGGIDFGPAASATLRVTPGFLTVEGDNVCTSTVAGVTFTGTSLEVSTPGAAATDLQIRTSSPLSVPVPSPTPLGSLHARPGVSAVTVHATDTRQTATLSSTDPEARYLLELPEGVTDVDGRPVQVMLNAGVIDFDLSTIPPQIALNLTGPLATPYLLSAGVGLRVPPSSEFGPASIAVSMFHSGTEWLGAKGRIPIAGVVPFLGDAITDAIDSGVILSLLPASTPPDPAATPSWLVVGRTQPGDVRLRVTPFAFAVIRPQDLLALRFQFEGVALQAIDGQVPELVIAEPRRDGTLSVVFPPQHLAEEAYYDPVTGFEQESDPSANPLEPPAIGVRLAGETTLAFVVPSDLGSKPLTLGTLLDWAPFTLMPGSGGSAGSAAETSIELPYRLMLSPDARAGFANGIPFSANDDRVDLWQARLGTRRTSAVNPATFFVDERMTPPVAIVGSPDYVPGERPDDSSMLPFAARAALTPSDRYDLAERGQMRVDRLAINRLTLTALGGSLDSRIVWDADPTGLTPGNDVAEWRHVAADGRDQYVRVVRLGVLFPFGHRASWVKITERRFTGGSDATGGNPAYLIERDFVVVTQPVVTYETPARDLPFVSLELLTLTTPTLDAPVFIDAKERAFWPTISKSPFRFHLRAIDVTGRSVTFDAPAVFVKADIGDPALIEIVGAAYDSPFSSRSTDSDLAGQKMAFAPTSSGNVEDTTLEVETVRFKAGMRAVSPDSVEFYPRIDRASVHLPAARALAATGGSGTVAIGYHPRYLGAGLDTQDPLNPAEVFAELYADLSASTPSPMKIGFTGEKSVGVAAPNMAISGLARRLGTVSGDINAVVTTSAAETPQFDVSRYFPDSATLLGGIRLKDLTDIFEPPSLSDPTGQGVPQLKVDATQAPLVRTFLEWNPRVQANAWYQTGVLQLRFTGDAPGQAAKSFSLQSQTVTGLPSVEPSASTAGRLTNFHLAFAPGGTALVTVFFNELSFLAENGRKPDVAIKLAPEAIRLGGDLDFLQVLMDKLRDILGSGPSVNVEGGTITAGYSVAVPAISIGVFSVENIRVSANIVIPLTGSDPITFRFAFAEKVHPFTLTVELLGGGGFFAIAVDSTGIQAIDLAIEAGANVSFDLAGLASGNAHVMVGVFFHYDAGTDVAITGYLRAGAELTVLQLISLHVEFYAGLTYIPAQHVLFASVSVTVDVAVATLHTSVTLSFERKFDVPGPDRARRLVAAGADRVTVSDVMGAPEWVEYAEAFA